jgi:hypothetical protein
MASVLDQTTFRYISNDSDALTRPGFGEKRAKSVKQVRKTVIENLLAHLLLNLPLLCFGL